MELVSYEYIVLVTTMPYETPPLSPFTAKRGDAYSSQARATTEGSPQGAGEAKSKPLR